MSGRRQCAFSITRQNYFRQTIRRNFLNPYIDGEPFFFWLWIWIERRLFRNSKLSFNEQSKKKERKKARKQEVDWKQNNRNIIKNKIAHPHYIIPPAEVPTVLPQYAYCSLEACSGIVPHCHSLGVSPSLSFTMARAWCISLNGTVYIYISELQHTVHVVERSSGKVQSHPHAHPRPHSRHHHQEPPQPKQQQVIHQGNYRAPPRPKRGRSVHNPQ